MRMNRRVWRKTAVVFTALLLILLLMSCGKKAAMTSEPNEETGGFEVTAENIYGSGNSGFLEIKEGQCLVISPQLQKGHFVLTVVPADKFDSAMEKEPAKAVQEINAGENGSGASLEIVVEGSAMSAYSLEPGEYYVFVMSEKEKTTGTMSVMPYSIEELRAQDAALADTLKDLPFDMDVPAPSENLDTTAK